MTAALPPSGWYPAPGEPGLERRWTGAEWSEERREAAAAIRTPAPAKPGLEPGQVMLLVFGAIFALLVLVGVLFPLTVFRGN